MNAFFLSVFISLRNRYKIFFSIDLAETIFVFSFFYINKKKVLNSRKFSTSGFRWVYTFWDILNTIWLFLENVFLSACLCVCDKKFLASAARELMNRISWNFVFSITPVKINFYQLLVDIVQQMALQSNVFQFFRNAQISASI